MGVWVLGLRAYTGEEAGVEGLGCGGRMVSVGVRGFSGVNGGLAFKRFTMGLDQVRREQNTQNH